MPVLAAAPSDFTRFRRLDANSVTTTKFIPSTSVRVTPLLTRTLTSVVRASSVSLQTPTRTALAPATPKNKKSL